ncbi:MAG TPA: protein kinase, partial [Pirellulaceae bacterium]|nr:protein kinase [Pirellulaceae bacterium]
DATAELGFHATAGHETAGRSAGTEPQVGTALATADGDVAGLRIGKFELRRVLGKGGQAIALLADDPDLQRPVVIKLYHAAQTPEAQQQVLDEGRALAQVRSPFVAQCFGADRHDGVPYLVVEYVPGATLSELNRVRPLAQPDAIELICHVAEGLSAIHAQGLLHRDLKPSNIIVDQEGRPRIVDFGLAATFGSERLRQISGTPAYMAPEQASGDVERIDCRTDIFGLGAVFYELLTGRPPYQGETQLSVWNQARDGQVLPAAQRQPSLKPAIADICMRCLAKEPAGRFASARELHERLSKHRRGAWKGLDFVLKLGRFKFRLALGMSAAVLLLIVSAEAVRRQSRGHWGKGVAFNNWTAPPDVSERLKYEHDRFGNELPPQPFAGGIEGVGGAGGVGGGLGASGPTGEAGPASATGVAPAVGDFPSQANSVAGSGNLPTGPRRSGSLQGGALQASDTDPGRRNGPGAATETSSKSAQSFGQVDSRDRGAASLRDERQFRFVQLAPLAERVETIKRMVDSRVAKAKGQEPALKDDKSSKTRGKANRDPGSSAGAGSSLADDTSRAQSLEIVTDGGWRGERGELVWSDGQSMRIRVTARNDCELAVWREDRDGRIERLLPAAEGKPLHLKRGRAVLLPSET